jgi:hypothetical protein
MSEGQVPYIFAERLDAGLILGNWAALLGKPYRLHGMSLFGDLFLIAPGGAVDMLDLVSGDCKQIAWCVEELEYEIGKDQGQREWLMAPLADAARRSGLQLAEMQCYAYRTPPMLGGSLDPSNLVPWDIYKYHSGLPKLFAQIRGLPAGTQIISGT